MTTTHISNLVKELNNTFPDFKFSNLTETYNVDAIIKIQSKTVPGKVTDLAYYGGNDCGYIPYHNFTDVYKFIKSKLSTCRRVSDFIDGTRKGFFEICF